MQGLINKINKSIVAPLPTLYSGALSCLDCNIVYLMLVKFTMDVNEHRIMKAADLLRHPHLQPYVLQVSETKLQYHSMRQLRIRIRDKLLSNKCAAFSEDSNQRVVQLGAESIATSIPRKPISSHGAFEHSKIQSKGTISFTSLFPFPVFDPANNTKTNKQMLPFLLVLFFLVFGFKGIVCMKMDSGFRGEGSNENKSEKNRKRSKKSMVQQLYETCNEVFATGEAGVVPSPQDVERLRSVLDNMKPADVGLTEDMPYFRKFEKEGAPPIIYLHVYECHKFSIGIFCLPPSGVIPLHNHPGMTVFSKLLFGSMHIKSYDWETDAPHHSKENTNHSQLPSVQPQGTRLAKVNTDSVFTAPCNTSILYPAAGGNMHCFTALTSCAVLDVLGPPYSDPAGRHCMYYQGVPCSSLLGNIFCLYLCLCFAR
ncbi:hypothetical protein IFM89_034954 [Coptis chinensis]|uniref:cysteine dioxygenase n=1 Tax=Coptis chinensis TaxID=261450 RepID=A0A835J031_9MAGN|nr:hypothetical protein IFM89_034954 [Coptis chinensis]